MHITQHDIQILSAAPNFPPAKEYWKQMDATCANGRWVPGVYAYKAINGVAQGGTKPGGALTAAEALSSVAFCAAALAKDKSCSTEFVGVASNNGHCWCVKAGDKCTQTKGYQYQFQKIGVYSFSILHIVCWLTANINVSYCPDIKPYADADSALPCAAPSRRLVELNRTSLICRRLHSDHERYFSLSTQ